MTKKREKNAIAIKNMEKPCKQSVLDPFTINELLQIFLTVNDEEMYGEVLEIILRVTESRYGVFGYIDENNGAFVAPSLSRDIWTKCEMKEKTICFPKETWGKSIWGRAIIEKRGFWNNQIGDLPKGHVRVKNVLVIPILFREKVVGALSVADREKGYGESEKMMLENIAEIIAPVLFARLERDRLNDKRALAEQALRESEKKYRVLVDNTPDIIFSLDRESRFTAVNQSYCRSMKLEAHEIIGKNHREIGFPDVLVQEWEGLHRQVFTTGKQVKAETTTSMPEGTTGTYEFLLMPVFGEKANIIGIRGRSRNVTELKKAERTLRDSEKYFRRIVELLPIALFSHGEEEILFANTAAAKLLHAANPEALIGKPLTEFILSEYRELFTEKLNEIMNKRNGKEKLMAKILSMTGDVIDTEFLFTPCIYQNNQVVQIVVFDMTRRKKIDEEILKADKLESISILAGGIAHDFNNIMAVILGNISLSLKEVKEDEKIFKRLKNVEKAIQQAKELTRQLQTFAKGGDPVKSTVSIEELTQEVVPFVLSGTNVQCHFNCPSELYYVDIDAGQISQVINNLVINALQAMPEGGRINVHAENVYVGESEDKSEKILKNGRYVKLMIQDSGIGIAESNLKKIFDPFFSTKVQGSGLGLSASYSIAKRHGGGITVESEPGEGTVFSIFLPASSNKVLEKKKGDGQIKRGSGRILVMDDDEAVRKVLGEMLSFLGYEVDFANEGAEAINKYKESIKLHTHYELVFLDLTVPGGMGGKQAMSIIKNIDPQVKAIVSTGYSEDLAEVNCKSYGFKGFIIKPYTIEQLSEIINGL